MTRLSKLRTVILLAIILSISAATEIGGAGGQMHGPLHLRAPDGTPMANAMLTMLHMLGLDDMESFGDSTAPMSFAAPVAE